MNMLIEGKWEKAPLFSNDPQGHFVRAQSVFRHWITSSGDSGFKAEPNRYHLYISYACPWACRTLIFLALKGLEDVISFSAVEPVIKDMGWEFGANNTDTCDPIYNAKYLF